MSIRERRNTGLCLADQEVYWKNELRGELPVLESLLDYLRPPVQSFIRASEPSTLGEEEYHALESLCSQEGVSPFIALVSALTIILLHHSGQEDIVIGSLSSDSIRATEAGAASTFANPVALRVDLSGDPGVGELLRRVAGTVAGAAANRDYPFERLIEQLQQNDDVNRAPIFQVMFVLCDVPFCVSDAPCSQEDLASVGEYAAQCDLVVCAAEEARRLRIVCEYDAQLFEPATIRRVLGHFRVLLQGIAANLAAPVSRLPLLTDAERYQLLVEFTNTRADYPREQCLAQLFEAQVARTPDAVAVVFRGQGSGVRGQGATTPLPPPARGGTEGGSAWASEHRSPVPPPAGGGTEGGSAWASEHRSPVPPPAGGGTEGGSAWASEHRSPVPPPAGGGTEGGSAWASKHRSPVPPPAGGGTEGGSAWASEHRSPVPPPARGRTEGGSAWASAHRSPVPPPAGGGTEGGSAWASAPLTPSPLHSFTPSPLHPFTQHLTYQELNQSANRLARLLREQGVGPEVVVGLLAERGAAFLQAVLAIFKAGGAYLPLDPRHHAQRLFQVLRQSGALCVLVADAFTPLLAQALDGMPSAQRPRVLRLEEMLCAARPEGDLPPAAAPENLAYVIYTSGSTGLPKGVMVEQRGMINHLYAKLSDLGVSAEDSIAQTASQCFDISVWQFLAALLVGGRVHIVGDELAHDSARLLRYVDHYAISILETVPSLLRGMLDARAERGAGRPALSALRWLVPTGEALPPELCRQWLSAYPSIPLLNAYGPTECSDDVTHHPIHKPPAAEVVYVPIGRPVANMRLYVLNAQSQPVPIGVTGELYVGGVGVGRGYLNQPDLTAATFIPNPFWGMGDGGWGMEDVIPIPHPPSPIPRLYKTGDLARYRPDGTIVFLGRRDQQVKVRGFRIELGEIEATLAQHPHLQAAVVVAREDVPGEKRLVAYVVTTNDQRPMTNDQERTPDAEPESFVVRRSSFVGELRDFLQARLPAYMVPAAFVILEALPLTPNGKVDYRALPAPDQTRPELDESYVPPRSVREEQLAAIWAELLGVTHVGVHDNFFDLGGHSLMATQVISQVRHAFQVELLLRHLFEAPTIDGLMKLIEAAGGASRQAPLRPVSRAGDLPLSFAQQRLWFLDQLESGSAVYNIAEALRLAGALDVAALARGLNEIVRRHDVWRTSFAALEGAPIQVIAPALHLPLQLLDLVYLPESQRDAAVARLANEEARQPFDLARGPLVRARLLRLDAEQHVLLLTTHHIVCDGWSMGVFFRELGALYAAFRAGRPSPLAPLPIQYADFAVWQRAWLQGSGVRGQGSGGRSQEATAPLPPPAGAGTEGGRGQGATTPLPPPAGAGTEGGRSQEATTPLPPPAGAGTEGGKSQEATAPLPPPAGAGTEGGRSQGATTPLPPPAGAGTEGGRSQGATTPLPPPAGAGTEGGKSQESDVGEGQTQNSKLKTQNSPLEAQLAYWRRQLDGAPALLELPADRPRPAVQTFRGATQRFVLPSELTEQLRVFSRREEATLFVTLLAAFKTLLYRYTGQQDILIGTAIANRNRAEIEPLIGFFANTLVLRSDLSGNPTFRGLLGRVRAVTLDAYEHQDLPFEKLVEELRPERDLSRNPLIQVLFVLQNAPKERLALPGLTVTHLEIENVTAKFDVTLLIEEIGRGLEGRLEYNADLFDTDKIERMVGHFQNLLAGVASDASQRLSELPLLTEAEQRQLLAWNDTAVAYAQDWCLHTLFEAQVARTPDAIAVVFDGPQPGVRGQGSGVRETSRQADKETRGQESGVRSQESEFLAPNRQFPTPLPPPAGGGTDARLPPPAGGGTDARLPPPAGGGTEGGSACASAPLSPQSSVLSPEHLTYCELNARANQLARYLQAHGVGPEVAVGVCAERSLELVIGLYGILKAGGAYVPLDPAYPQERLVAIARDARVALVLFTTTDDRRPTTDQRPTTNDQRPEASDQRPTTTDLRPATCAVRPQSKIQNPKSKIVHLDADWPLISQAPAAPLVVPLAPDNLAYLIYTSGSTGQPKGIMNTHQGICNRLLWIQDAYRLTADDCVLQKTPFSFDVSIWEFFWPLTAGARLVMARQDGHKDSAYLVEVTAQQRITTLNFVPSMLQIFLDEPGLARCTCLRRVLASGEALPYGVQERFFARLDADLYNLYGPTEAAVDITSWACERSSQRRVVPIGRPVANTQIYLLDADLRPLPLGIPGEIYLGGAGLARGYLGRPDLTAAAFIPNPFAEGMGDGGWGMEESPPIPHPPSPIPRLYKTGDLARYLPDGAIEYLGRLDDQVKLRGFRIELGEIEATLRQHPSVREAVVTLREDAPGEKRLIAYVVPTNDQRPTTNDQRPKIEDGRSKIEDRRSPALHPRSSILDPQSSVLSPQSSVLRAFLQAKLPDYMIPSAFVALEQLPLTPSGKIDRRALPAPGASRPEPAAAYVAPRSAVEEVLAGIWTEVLGLDQVGVHDNFFELGGHSLLATRVISKIRGILQVALPVRSLFEEPTIADLTAVLLQDPSEREQIEAAAEVMLRLAYLSDEEVESMLDS